MSSSEPPTLTQGDAPAPTESEPLLGRPGDATQKPDAPLFNNLFLGMPFQHLQPAPLPTLRPVLKTNRPQTGTAWLAQLGAVLLLLITFSAVLTTQPFQPLLSPHPLLQSIGVFAVLQAILLLQPTTTPSTKRAGQRGHALLHLASLSLFAAGATVIQVNKHAHRLPHFHSLHAYLGVGTLGLLLLQYAFGFTIWATPAVWGGEEKAKALWKVHRWAGYAALALLLATVAAAAETDYARDKWRVKLWAVLVAEGLIVAGVFPRVHLRKLGLRG